MSKFQFHFIMVSKLNWMVLMMVTMMLMNMFSVHESGRQTVCWWWDMELWLLLYLIKNLFIIMTHYNILLALKLIFFSLSKLFTFGGNKKCILSLAWNSNSNIVEGGSVKPMNSSWAQHERGLTGAAESAISGYGRDKQILVSIPHHTLISTFA